MNLKIYMVVVMLCFFIATAHASVIINEVYPNPIVSEYDGEFIELYNTGNQSVDIGNWTIDGLTEIKVSIPSGTTIKPNRYFLIADGNFNTGKDDSAWPNADIEQEMTLKNTNDTLMLKNGTNIIDIIGWGSSNADGSPAQPPEEGKSLERVNFSITHNNSYDFKIGTPTPTNSTILNDDGLHLIFHINNMPPVIENVEILKDDSGAEGIQILPHLEENTTVPFNVVLSDLNGGEDISNVFGIFSNVSFNLTRESTNGTYASYKGNMSIPIKFPFGKYNVTLVGTDTEGLSANNTVVIEVLPILAIKLSNALLDFGSMNPGQYSNEAAVLIENMGNAPLLVGFSGTALQSDSGYIPVDNVAYKTGGQWFNLSLETSFMQEIIDASMQQSALFKLFVPKGSAAEAYNGKITLTAIAA